MRVILLASMLSICCLCGGWSTATADEIDRLITAATTGSYEVRLQALKALGKSGDIRALPPLLAAVNDQNAPIREQAVAALRALAQTLHAVYRAVAQWIRELLATLPSALAPPPLPPDVEWTRHVQHI
ncbi:MAG TPA: HEAT repeat domain-containing protein [Candidatus Tectomicrobia bacterium]